MTAWAVRAVQLPDGDDLDAGITADGRWSTEPPPDAEPLPGRFALPGLVDAHRHLTVAAGEDGLPYAVDINAARANLDAARRAGITTVRDTGSPAGAVLTLTPDVDGLLVCGRFLAPANRFFPALLPEPVPAEHLVEAALAELSAGRGGSSYGHDREELDCAAGQAAPREDRCGDAGTRGVYGDGAR